MNNKLLYINEEIAHKKTICSTNITELKNLSKFLCKLKQVKKPTGQNGARLRGSEKRGIIHSNTSLFRKTQMKLEPF